MKMAANHRDKSRKRKNKGHGAGQNDGQATAPGPEGRAAGQASPKEQAGIFERIPDSLLATCKRLVDAVRTTTPDSDYEESLVQMAGTMTLLQQDEPISQENLDDRLREEEYQENTRAQKGTAKWRIACRQTLQRFREALAEVAPLLRKPKLPWLKMTAGTLAYAFTLYAPAKAINKWISPQVAPV